MKVIEIGSALGAAPARTEAAEPQRRKLTMEEFRASRLDRPAGIAPVTLEDMERAIVEGALASGTLQGPKRSGGEGSR